MMKKIYSVYDVKTGVYGMLMVLISDGEAMRVIMDSISGQDNTLARHPEDYRLECLGDINMATGEIITVSKPKHVVDVAQLVTPKEVK